MKSVQMVPKSMADSSVESQSLEWNSEWIIESKSGETENDQLA